MKKVYKELARIEDTIYGYEHSATGELVFFIEQVLKAKQKILFWNKDIEITENLSSWALPMSLEQYIIELCDKEVWDKDTIKQAANDCDERYIEMIENYYQDAEESVKIQKNILLNKIKYSKAFDNNYLYRNLVGQGWVPVFTDKQYVIKKQYFFSSSEDKDLRIAIIRYYADKKNNKYQILDCNTFVIPKEFIDNFKKEMEK